MYSDFFFLSEIMLGPVPFENDAKFGLLKIISTKLCNKICREKNIKYLEQLVDSVTNQLKNPPKFWEREFFEYYRIHVPKYAPLVPAKIQEPLIVSYATLPFL